jgi:phage-related protein
MPDDISTVVSRLRIEATDDASPVLDRLGAKADAVAAQMQAAMQGAAADIDSKLAVMGAGGASGIERTMASALREIGLVNVALDNLDTHAADAEGSLGNFTDVFRESSGLASDFAKELQSAGRSIATVGKNAAVAEDPLASITKTISDSVGRIQAYSDAMERAAPLAKDFNNAHTGLSGKLGREADALDRLNPLMADYAKNLAAARDAAAGLKAETGSAEVGGAAATEASTQSGVSSDRRQLNSFSRSATATGLGLLALPTFGVYEDMQYQNAFENAGHNAMLPQPVIDQIARQAMQMFSSNPVSYDQIATAFQRAAEEFQQHKGESDSSYAKRLTGIVDEAMRSAVSTNPSSLGDIAQILSKIEFSFGLSQKQSQHAMDEIHAIGGLGGNMSLQDLSQTFGRPAATGSMLGFSVPQIGGLFDTLSKQFGPTQTATYLNGLFQHMLTQTKGSESMLANIGMAGEWNQVGAEKYGPYKLLSDLIGHADAYSASTGGKTTVGDILQAIIPGQRGGLAVDALFKDGHLGQALSDTLKLGGTAGHDASKLGSGDHSKVYGVTESQYKASMDEPVLQMKTMLNSLKGLAMQITAAIEPGVMEAVKSVKPLVTAFGDFLKQHPGIVKAATEIGGALLGIGVAAKGISLLSDLASPVGMVLALAAACVLLYTNVKPVHDFINQLASDVLPALKTALHDVWDFLQQFGTAFANAFEHTPEYGDALKQVKQGLTEVWNAIKPVLDSLGLFSKGGKDGGDTAKTLATILNDILKIAVQALALQFKLTADAISTYIVLARDIVKTVVDEMVNTFHILQDAVKLVTDIFSGNWSQVGKDTQKLKQDVVTYITDLKNDVSALFGDLWTNVKHFVSDLVQGVVSLFTTLYDTLVGHSIVPDMIKAIAQWFTNLPGMIAGALGTLITNVVAAFTSIATGVLSKLADLAKSIAGWIGDEAGKFVGYGEDILTHFANGITNKAGAIKDALVNAVKGAANAALDWLKGHNPLSVLTGNSGGAVSGPNTPAGGGILNGSQFGPYGSASANYISSGDAAMLRSLGIGYSSALTDTDFPAAAGTPYRLPPGGAYRLVSQGIDPNVGGYEVWKNTANGGTIMFLHGEAVSGGEPSPYSVGATVKGGTYVGRSGHPLTTAYGNNPAFYHLCVVTDSGEQVWLNESQMQAMASGQHGGGGPVGGGGVTAFHDHSGTVTVIGGNGKPVTVDANSLQNPLNPVYATTLGLAAQAQTGSAALVTNPNQALPALEKIGSQTIPDLEKQIQTLPESLAKPLEKSLDAAAGDWNKYMSAYNTGVAKENKTHEDNLAAIQTRYNNQVQSIFERFNVTETASRDRALQRQADLYASADEAQRHTLADFNVRETTANERALASAEKIMDSASSTQAEKEKALSQLASSLKISQSEAQKMLDENLQHRKAIEDQAIQNLHNETGISLSKAKAMLDIELQSRKQSEDQAIEKEDQRHTKALAALKSVLEGHVNNLASKLNAITQTLAADLQPDKLWAAIGQGYANAISKGTATGDYTALYGKDQTSTTYSTSSYMVPIYDQNGELVAYKMRNNTTATTTTTTVDQQLQTQAQDVAKQVQQQNAMSLAAAKFALMVDQSTGNLSQMSSDMGTVSGILTNDILAELMAGKPVTQQYVQGLVDIANAQQDAQEVQSGLNLTVAASRYDLATMGTEAQNITPWLQQWTQAVMEGQGAENSSTTVLRKMADTADAVAKASADQEVVVGELTGQYSMLFQGLSTLFTTANDKINLFTASIGRTNDGLMTAVGAIGDLTTQALAAAANMPSLSSMISSFNSVISSIVDAGGTEVARGGSVSSGTISAYAQAQDALYGATADQTSAALQMAKGADDLQGYYAALGNEIQLQQRLVDEDAAKYGLHSTQVQKDTAVLKQLQDEYNGLGYAIDSINNGTKLTAQQSALAAKAMQAFTNSGVDPAMTAIQQLTATFPVTDSAFSDFQTETKTAAQDASDLGTAAESAAGPLGTLATRIGDLAGAIARAIAAINTAAGDTTAGTTGGSTTGLGGAASTITNNGLNGVGGILGQPTPTGRPFDDPTGAFASHGFNPGGTGGRKNGGDGSFGSGSSSSDGGSSGSSFTDGRSTNTGSSDNPPPDGMSGAYTMGYTAGATGYPNQNPYPPGSQPYQDYQSGWSDGAALFTSGTENYTTNSNGTVTVTSGGSSATYGNLGSISSSGGIEIAPGMYYMGTAGNGTGYYYSAGVYYSGPIWNGKLGVVPSGLTKFDPTQGLSPGSAGPLYNGPGSPGSFLGSTYPNPIPGTGTPYYGPNAYLIPGLDGQTQEVKGMLQQIVSNTASTATNTGAIAQSSSGTSLAALIQQMNQLLQKIAEIDPVMARRLKNEVGAGIDTMTNDSGQDSLAYAF